MQHTGTVRVVGWICPHAFMTVLVMLYLSAYRILDSLPGAQLLKLDLSNLASWEHFDLFSYSADAFKTPNTTSCLSRDDQNLKF